jgi:hypothetical protein
MLGLLWRRWTLWVAIAIIAAAVPAAATSRNYVYVGSDSGQL